MSCASIKKSSFPVKCESLYTYIFSLSLSHGNSAFAVECCKSLFPLSRIGKEVHIHSNRSNSWVSGMYAESHILCKSGAKV